MATHGGSSSSPPPPQGSPIVEDDVDLISGAESGWVEARTSCDHLPSLSSDLVHIPTPDTHCNRGCQMEKDLELLFRGSLSFDINQCMTAEVLNHTLSLQLYNMGEILHLLDASTQMRIGYACAVRKSSAAVREQAYAAALSADTSFSCS